MVLSNELRPEFQAVILCGPGSRLYPISNNDILPKPLIPIAGKPLISYTLSWLEKESIYGKVDGLILYRRYSCYPTKRQCQDFKLYPESVYWPFEY